MPVEFIGEEGYLERVWENEVRAKARMDGRSEV